VFRYIDIVRNKMKKALRETQTLRCSKAEPKIFAPPQTHFGTGRPKCNQEGTAPAQNILFIAQRTVYCIHIRCDNFHGCTTDINKKLS